MPTSSISARTGTSGISTSRNRVVCAASSSSVSRIGTRRSTSKASLHAYEPQSAIVISAMVIAFLPMPSSDCTEGSSTCTFAQARSRKARAR